MRTSPEVVILGAAARLEDGDDQGQVSRPPLLALLRHLDRQPDVHFTVVFFDVKSRLADLGDVRGLVFPDEISFRSKTAIFRTLKVRHEQNVPSELDEISADRLKNIEEIFEIFNFIINQCFASVAFAIINSLFDFNVVLTPNSINLKYKLLSKHFHSFPYFM